MNTDVIIVGHGLAGSILGYKLVSKGYRVRIFDDGENNSSAAAAGLFNPITGKRLAKTWLADEIFPYLHEFYQSLERELKVKIFHPMPLYRPFGSAREMNEWSSKSKDGLNNTFVEQINDGHVLPGTIRDPFGGMHLRSAGFVNVPVLIRSLKEFFLEKNILVIEKFDESRTKVTHGGIEYNGITASRLVYCNGLSAAGSRFFSWLPFRPVKGEILVIELETELGFILNKGIFIIPENGKVCKAGATYNREEPYSGISQEGREWILARIRKLVNSEVRVIEHYSGIRPATHDRRPFIGFHPEWSGVGIFNGFGSKGVSLIPWFAEKFIHHMGTGADLEREAKIFRFFN
ncbi:MAG TPA: FAD-dependent oxidoreductase [Cyclobacteriaceae bacterium]|nr:FAD-dependent oxidoreductase [Cyclobacteriaceae bacterium]